MQKGYLILIICLCAQICSAQFAVISAPDGYANIRVRPNVKSSIIKKLQKNTVVFLDEDYNVGDRSSPWRHVYFSEDLFFKDADETLKNLKKGFVHKSQIVDMFDLDKPEENEFSITYNIGDFNFKNKKIVWGEGKHYVASVNGQNLFGADCGLPKTEIVKAFAKIKDSIVPIQHSLLLNILSAQNGFRYFKNSEMYFAFQTNGDGGCFYHVLWAFENGRLKQRLIGNIY